MKKISISLLLFLFCFSFAHAQKFSNEGFNQRAYISYGMNNLPILIKKHISLKNQNFTLINQQDVFPFIQLGYYRQIGPLSAIGIDLIDNEYTYYADNLGTDENGNPYLSHELSNSMIHLTYTRILEIGKRYHAYGRIGAGINSRSEEYVSEFNTDFIFAEKEISASLVLGVEYFFSRTFTVFYEIGIDQALQKVGIALRF